MILSKYNLEVPLEDNKYILYNTLRRKYLLYTEKQREYINNLSENINKDQYTMEEANLIKSLCKKGIVLKNNINELDVIEYMNKKVRYEGRTLNLVIQTTLDCNFRCTYCYEQHNKVKIDDVSLNKIISYIKNIGKNFKKINIGWFGGEPLLEYKKICEITSEVKKFCNENHIIYNAAITTNGYLFTDEIIDNIDELNIKSAQITLDGPEEYHNKKRPLSNNEGTYKKVLENIIKLARKNIHVTLRINVDYENHRYLDALFDAIPKELRSKIEVNISNLFQSEEMEIVNIYNIYKSAIDKGFIYGDTTNKFYHCEVCTKDNITIAPDCSVVPCSVAAEKGYKYGEINYKGELVLKDKSLFYSLKNTSAMTNSKCRKCKELPMCMGRCTFARYKNQNICNGSLSNGISIIERIKLHYYNDLKNQNILEEVSLSV